MASIDDVTMLPGVPCPMCTTWILENAPRFHRYHDGEQLVDKDKDFIMDLKVKHGDGQLVTAHPEMKAMAYLLFDDGTEVKIAEGAFAIKTAGGEAIYLGRATFKTRLNVLSSQMGQRLFRVKVVATCGEQTIESVPSEPFKAMTRLRRLNKAPAKSRAEVEQKLDQAKNGRSLGSERPLSYYYPLAIRHICGRLNTTAGRKAPEDWLFKSNKGTVKELRSMLQSQFPELTLPVQAQLMELTVLGVRQWAMINNRPEYCWETNPGHGLPPYPSTEEQRPQWKEFETAVLLPAANELKLKADGRRMGFVVGIFELHDLLQDESLLEDIANLDNLPASPTAAPTSSSRKRALEAPEESADIDMAELIQLGQAEPIPTELATTETPPMTPPVTPATEPFSEVDPIEDLQVDLDVIVGEALRQDEFSLEPTPPAPAAPGYRSLSAYRSLSPPDETSPKSVIQPAPPAEARGAFSTGAMYRSLSASGAAPATPPPPRAAEQPAAGKGEARLRTFVQKLEALAVRLPSNTSLANACEKARSLLRLCEEDE